MTATPAPALAGAREDRVRAMPAGWRVALVRLALVSAAILLLLARDVGDMVSIWLTSADFGHCLLIPPIVAAIVWGRRAGLVRLIPAVWPAGLVLVAAAALVWLAGWAGGLAVARHLGLVLMLGGSVVTITGPAVARALAFPLGYALFMVPAGDELTGPLQEATARMAMALLDWTGLAATREGSFITTADGLFRVAPACAGVNFLLAMVALGVLVAWAGFRGWPKRIGFIAACVAVPILANGVRAYATIWAAGPLGIDFAASYDHVFYGWFFFAIIVALLVGSAWRWFDRPADDWRRVESGDGRAMRAPTPAPAAPVLAALLALALLPPVWAAAGDGARAALPQLDRLPPAPGWQRAPQAGPRWLPQFAGARTMVIDDVVDAAGRRVSVALVRFDRQVEGAELIGFGQGAANPALGWLWSASAPAPEGAIGAELRGPDGAGRVTATFLHMAGRTTGSAIAIKALTARARLTGADTAGAALVLSADPAAGGAEAIADWLQAAGGADAVLARSLDAG